MLRATRPSLNMRDRGGPSEFTAWRGSLPPMLRGLAMNRSHLKRAVEL